MNRKKSNRNEKSVLKSITLFILIMFFGILNTKAQEVDSDQIDDNLKNLTEQYFSIENNADYNEMSLYSDMKEGIFKLIFESAIKKCQVLLYNQNGNISYSKSFLNAETTNYFEINPRNYLPSGRYFLHVRTPDGDTYIQRIEI